MVQCGATLVGEVRKQQQPVQSCPGCYNPPLLHGPLTRRLLQYTLLHSCCHFQGSCTSVQLLQLGQLLPGLLCNFDKLLPWMVKVNTIYACCNIHCEGLALLSNNVVNTLVCCYIHFHTLTLASYGQAMLLMEVVARTEKLKFTTIAVSSAQLPFTGTVGPTVLVVGGREATLDCRSCTHFRSCVHHSSLLSALDVSFV